MNAIDTTSTPTDVLDPKAAKRARDAAAKREKRAAAKRAAEVEQIAQPVESDAEREAREEAEVQAAIEAELAKSRNGRPAPAPAPVVEPEPEADVEEQAAPAPEPKAKRTGKAKATAPTPAEPPAPRPEVKPVELPEFANRISTSDVVARALTANANGSIIGAVTFWSLHGIRVRRTDLRVALSRLGLSFACPKDPKPQACLRMAVDIVRRASEEDVVFDRVSDTKAEVVYAMSSRSTDERLELANYQHRTRIRLDKLATTIMLEDTTDPVLQAVEAKYLEIRDYITTTEFGLVLINALRGRRHAPGLSAVNLRGETGGVYFVPGPNVAKLNALADLVDAVGGKGAITVWPIPAGERALAQAVDAARVDFTERVAATRKDVLALLQTITEDDDVDPEGRRVLARAKAFAGLRARVVAYSDILGDMKGELEEQLSTLRKAIETRIGASMGGDFDLGAADDDDDGEEA